MVEAINVDRSFVALVNCTVVYQGRASSILEPGTYLLIHKSDGTLLIHGATLFTPLNYQPPGAVLRLDGHRLFSTRKKETIQMLLSEVLWYKETEEISNHKIKISKTEKELRDYIVKENFPHMLAVYRCRRANQENEYKVKEVFIEHPTPYGPIDILMIDSDNTIHVIEVKRGKASLAACAQLQRYMRYYEEIGKPHVGWILSPEISSGAEKYCGKHGIWWQSVSHRPDSILTNCQ